MIGAIAFSGFLALSLTPMLCSKLLRQEERGTLHRLGRRSLPEARGLLRPLARLGDPQAAAAAGSGWPRSWALAAAGLPDAPVRAGARRGPGHRAGPAERARGHRLRPDGPLYAAGAGEAAAAARGRRGSHRSSRVPRAASARATISTAAHFIVFLKPWEERETTTQQVAQQINKHSCRDARSTRQRAGALGAGARARAADRLRDRGQHL